MKKSSVVISARLSRDRVKVVEEMAREEKVDKSTILDRALERYAKDWRLQKAVELYQVGSVTMSRAAEIAGISIWELIDVLADRRVLLQYDVEDLEEDLKVLRYG